VKVIGVFGKKGGSGKTLVSHFIAHGLSKGLDIDTIVFQTDVRTVRPDEFNLKRQYAMTSVPNNDPDTDLEHILKVYAKFATQPNLVMIIDGGANRSALDLALAPLCDIVLIPFGTSKEDIDVADNDYWAIRRVVHDKMKKSIAENGAPFKDTKVVLLQNRWPGVKAKLDSLMAKPRISEYIYKAETQGMIFPKYIADMQSLTDIANADDPRSTLMIDAQSRAFARYMALALGMEVREDGNYVEVDEDDTDGEDGNRSAA
jgi:cellulose biosynthesis protein BcsQ